MASRPQSPLARVRSLPAPEVPKESVVSRLLIAPLTFISFLISLALIDSRNHSHRTHSHSPPHPPPTGILGHTKAFLHRCVYKQTSSSSPYAYISSPSLSPNSSTPNNEGNGKGRVDEPWYWHTKQRKMMKAEFSDAFRIRNWVLVVLVLSVAIATVGVLAFVRWAILVWRGWGADMIAGVYTKSEESVIYPPEYPGARDAL